MATISTENDPDIDGFYKFINGQLIKCLPEDPQLLIIVSTCQPPPIPLTPPPFPLTPPPIPFTPPIPNTPSGTPRFSPSTAIVPYISPDPPPQSDSPLFWNTCKRSTTGENMGLRTLSRHLFSTKAWLKRKEFYRKLLL